MEIEIDKRKAPAEQLAHRDRDDPQSPEFGYGHRAHRPDPQARYGFDPGAPRALPKNKTNRWRVAG